MTPDERRLESLARAHGPRVLAYLARRVTPREEAADVWQHTLLTTWRKIHAVPSSDDQALAWLIGVARGELANHRRLGERRHAATERLRDMLTIGEPTAYEGTKAGPVGEAGEAGEAGTVAAALATLEPIDREVVTLTYWDGLTSEQVGAALGLRAGTVRKRLERARARLATALTRHPADVLG